MFLRVRLWGAFFDLRLGLGDCKQVFQLILTLLFLLRCLVRSFRNPVYRNRLREWRLPEERACNRFRIFGGIGD
jgi:hypothetical protein